MKTKADAEKTVRILTLFFFLYHELENLRIVLRD